MDDNLPFDYTKEADKFYFEAEGTGAVDVIEVMDKVCVVFFFFFSFFFLSFFFFYRSLDFLVLFFTSLFLGWLSSNIDVTEVVSNLNPRFRFLLLPCFFFFLLSLTVIHNNNQGLQMLNFKLASIMEALDHQFPAPSNGLTDLVAPPPAVGGGGVNGGLMSDGMGGPIGGHVGGDPAWRGAMGEGGHGSSEMYGGAAAHQQQGGGAYGGPGGAGYAAYGQPGGQGPW